MPSKEIAPMKKWFLSTAIAAAALTVALSMTSVPAAGQYSKTHPITRFLLVATPQ